MKLFGLGVGAAAALVAGMPASAQSRPLQSRTEVEALRAELTEAKERLRWQEERLNALETRMRAAPPASDSSVAAAPPASAPAPAVGVAQGSASTAGGDPTAVQAAPVQTVGVAPDEFDRAPQVAVLGELGNVITRAGQLSVETQLEYARADRNRAVFRGIEPVESVLVGVFDINESRQDVVTAAYLARYGVTGRLEVGARVPLVRRSDSSILAPVPGSASNDLASTIDSSANGSGLGDVELSLRYQLTRARPGNAFLIANLQVVAPTGSNPFDVRRDSIGRALEAATGAGFWGISPSITAILPSDPAVLFGTIGYTRNFGENVNTEISPVRILFVKPGDAVSASAGIGLSLNQRTSLNLGYAHTWAFGTLTRTQLISPQNEAQAGVTEQRARDLQVGRFLFGVTQRVTDRASINWSVELGATDDATDLRTVLRVPIILLTGGR